MKKINIIFICTLFFLIIYSCTSFDDAKEISGTLVFNEVGTHSFSINADNIDATITLVGANNGEIQTFENVSLSKTANYTAKIGGDRSTNLKTVLLNNLVVMYEAESGRISQNITPVGYVKIEWKGID